MMMGEARISVGFYKTDYWYFGHVKVIATSDKERGFNQGFGFFVLTVLWCKRPDARVLYKRGVAR